MKLRKCIRHQCNTDYIGISLLGNDLEVIKVVDLKTEKSFYLDYRVLNIFATITKHNVSLHEMPIVAYTIDL